MAARLGLLILLIMPIMLSAGCADKAPPALFPHPQPPELARPIQPTCGLTKAEGDPAKPAETSRPPCEDEPVSDP